MIRPGRAVVRACGVGLACLAGGLLLPTVGAGAAAQSTAAAPTLTAELPGTIGGCDPVGSTVTSASTQVLSLVLPSVTQSSPSGSLALADSAVVQAEVVNLSPLTVQYQLRKGATWVNGRQIGLQDFITTWHIGAHGNGPSAASYRLVRKVVRGSAPRGVQVTFTRPTSSWQALFSPLLPAGTSPRALARCSAPNAQVNLSAGPYVIAASSTSGVILVRNPRWWGAQPPFAWIDIKAESTSSAATALSTVPAGSLALIERSWVSSQTLAALVSNPYVSSQVDSSNRLLSLDFSTNHGPTAIPKVRLAISHLIDRAKLIASTAALVDPRIVVASSHLVSQGQPGYGGTVGVPLAQTTTTTSHAATPTTSASPNAKGIAVARRDLLQAGWHRRGSLWVDRQGRALSVGLAVPVDDPWAASAAAALARQLASHGIGVHAIFAPSSAAVASQLRSGSVGLGLLARPTDPFIAHAAQWFAVPPTGPSSALWAGYRNQSVSQLAVQADQILNASTAQHLYQSIDHLLWTTMPSLPLYTEPFVTAWTSTLGGVVDNPYPPGTLAEAPSWVVNSDATVQTVPPADR